MKRTRFGAWLVYAAAGLGLTLLAAFAATLLVQTDERAIWIPAAIAYGLQLVSFALLIAVRDNSQLFMLAWAGGLLLRFGMLGLGAYVLSATDALPRTATLLSYVTFVFGLLLLEPVFLRWDLRRQ